jgi:ABC-type transport system substrate-binding protein
LAGTQTDRRPYGRAASEPRRVCLSIPAQLLALARYPNVAVKSTGQPGYAEEVFVENYGGYDDDLEIALYEKMLHEPDALKQRALMRDFEKYVIDTQAHELPLTFWYRIAPYRSYVKGWKIGPSHYINQDLATVWLDK